MEEKAEELQELQQIYEETKAETAQKRTKLVQLQQEFDGLFAGWLFFVVGFH